jgi:hypothetical protein
VEEELTALSTLREVARASILLLGSLLTGCTVTYIVPSAPVALPYMERVDLTVTLRLTDEFCNARWKRGSGILPIGQALCLNAESVTRAVFSDVRVMRGDGAPAASDAKATLTPRLAAFERNDPLGSVWSTQTTSMLLEWTLNDDKGDPVWVTTITAEGKGPRGNVNMSSSAGREQVVRVLDDAFQKSAREMSTAVAIREFAASRRPR